MPERAMSISYFEISEKSSDTEPFTALDEDQQRLDEIAARVEELRNETVQRIARRGKDHAGNLQQSLERDIELNELGQRLRQLDRMGPIACLGFMQNTTTGERQYIGRVGLSDAVGKQLMLDWRAPAAEPFFAATHENPYGLSLRRRYRWRRQVITDFWDEVFDSSLLSEHQKLDDRSSFLASLSSTRTSKMQDVLSTIQTDQDAIIRASSKGALVVDGGPGTGKTVVALHRAAYLLYADPRLRSQGGKILVVSPHEAYSAYVSDILPNLGEEEVQISTLSNIVSIEGEVLAETDPDIIRIKASTSMLNTVQRAVKVFQLPPNTSLEIQLTDGQVTLSPELWRNAVSMVDSATPHNEARVQLREALIELLLPHLASEASLHQTLRHELERNTDLAAHLNECWPLLDPMNLLRSLYTTPALLRYSGVELGDDDIKKLLAAPSTRSWTNADIPLIDLSRSLIGDPANESKRQRREATVRAERQQWKSVISDLVQSADDKEDLSSQLIHEDLQEQLLNQHLEADSETEIFDGPYSHVVIDEAQDLTDVQWAMILRRCPSGSLTIVGDRAQASRGFTGSWEERLSHLGIRDATVSQLRVNYRSTAQIMEVAATQIHSQMPDANVPDSLRSDGESVRFASPTQLTSILEQWLANHPEGTAAVIGHPAYIASNRVSSLSPENAKGLEFDFVAVYKPENFGTGLSGAVRRYVSMTRATAQLVVLTDQ